MTRYTGTVIWFSDPKGFGFIKPDKGEKDIFFYYEYLHISVDEFKTVKPNTRVSFEIGENHRGPMAINIKEGEAEILNEPEPSEPTE